MAGRLRSEYAESAVVAAVLDRNGDISEDVGMKGRA
jgi:hypothetical protein